MKATSLSSWSPIAAVVTLILIVGVLCFGMYQDSERNIAAANTPRTLEQIRAGAPSAALQGCENWTRESGPVGMGKIVREYEQVGKPLAGDHYRVAFDYRSEGSGALMRSTCEYSLAGGKMFLVHASSGARP